MNSPSQHVYCTAHLDLWHILKRRNERKFAVKTPNKILSLSLSKFQHGKMHHIIRRAHIYSFPWQKAIKTAAAATPKNTWKIYNFDVKIFNMLQYA